MLPFLQLIFAIAIIIAAAKLGGYLSHRLGQPTVAGKVLVEPERQWYCGEPQWAVES